MFLSRRAQGEAPQEQRELTQAELAEVTGGVMCSREPGSRKPSCGLRPEA